MFCMRITFKQLKKLSVETLSGALLGLVYDVVIDCDSQTIIQYKVKKNQVIGSKQEYLISKDQVARYEEQKLIVYDTAIPRKKVSQPSDSAPVATDPVVAMRNKAV